MRHPWLKVGSCGRKDSACSSVYQPLHRLSKIDIYGSVPAAEALRMRFSADIIADSAFSLAFSAVSPADYLASVQSPTHL